MPIAPRPPAPLHALADRVFEGLAAARHARVFHPRGTVLRGTLRVTDRPTAFETDLFHPGATREVAVRISRGVGLPQVLPDVLGVAVKVPDAYGRGRDQDILMASSLGTGPGRAAFGWRWDLTGSPFSTVLPMDLGGTIGFLGAVVDGAPGESIGTDRIDLELAVADGRLRIHLLMAPLLGHWRELAVIEPVALAPPEWGERLRFDPWHTGGGIRPVGPFQRLRTSAYEASRRGRDADGPAIAVPGTARPDADAATEPSRVLYLTRR